MANILEWSEEYSVGNRLMDQQHQQILSLINDLHNHPAASIHSAMFSDVLRRLGSYASTHLAAEEALLLQIEYPQLSEHKKLHAEYLERYEDLLSALMRQEEDGAERLISFLIEWWVDHILAEDMKYRPYVLSEHL